MSISKSNLKSAAATQIRVILALVLREIRVRYGRTSIGYAWALIEPAAAIILLIIVFSASGRRTGTIQGHDIKLFYSSGIMAFFFYQKTVAQITNAFDANKQLFMFPIVHRIDSVIARFILDIITLTCVSTILFTALIFAFKAPPPRNLFIIMEAALVLATMGMGVGLINAVVSEIFKSWRNIFGIVTTPMFLLSGVFYGLETLPPTVRAILSWNPVIHGVELFRQGYFGFYRAPGLDLQYATGCALGVLLLGLMLERVIWRDDE